MKGRFALALLASVAMIAAMATDASAADHGGKAADIAAAVVDSMAAVVAASCTWAAAAASMRMGGGGLRMVWWLACRRQRLSRAMHSAAAISARCARAACTDMRGADLGAGAFSHQAMPRGAYERIRPGPWLCRAKCRRAHTRPSETRNLARTAPFVGRGAGVAAGAALGAAAVRRTRNSRTISSPLTTSTACTISIRPALTGTRSATLWTLESLGRSFLGRRMAPLRAAAGAAGPARSSGPISTATCSASRSGLMTITIRSGSMAPTSCWWRTSLRPDRISARTMATRRTMATCPALRTIRAAAPQVYYGGAPAGRLDVTKEDRQALAGNQCRGDGKLQRPGAGMSDLPIEQIKKTVRPTGDQLAVLDELKAAALKAQETVKASCPTAVPLTPVARLDAAEARLDTMIQAVQIVRDPLQQFYDALNDEQRHSFETMGSSGGGNAPAGGNLAALCNQQSGDVAKLPIERIEQVVQPTGQQQQDAFNALKQADRTMPPSNYKPPARRKCRRRR